MKYRNLKGSAILCTAALVWGLAFTAQSQAADLVPSFMINALRSFIAAAALYALFLILGRKKRETFFPKEKTDLKRFLIGGLICGLFLAFSANFQMFGIAAYPEGVASEARAGFLTSLYVILVPIVSIFIGKKANWLVWISVIVAFVCVYMLCFSGSFGAIYLGDVLMFICALGFTFHIICIDKYVSFVGGIKLSVMQFMVTAVVSLIMSFIFEWKTLSIENIMSAALPIIYLGIMSSGVGYTLQIIGQKYAEPAVASISMSLESVFAALGGWVILGNSLNLKEIFGCLLVFAAIILAQLPEFSKSRKIQN